MKISRRWGRVALLFLAVAVLAAGCAPRGASANAGWTVLAAGEDQVYAVLPTGRVLALEAEKGEPIWQYPTTEASSGVGCGVARTASSSEEVDKPVGAVYGQPVVEGDLLLIGSYDGNIYALDRKTGQRLWALGVGDSIIGGLTVADGVAYFGAADHNLYALDLTERTFVWEKPFQTKERIWGAPTVSGERVYVGSMDRFVYAVERATGAEVWRTKVGAAIPGDVAVAEGRVFAGGVDGRLHVLDAETGALLWETERLDGWIWGKPLVVNGHVYVATLKGTLYGFEVAKGQPIWDLVTLVGSVRADLALYDGKIVAVTDAGLVYLVDQASGRVEAIYGEGKGYGPLLSPPVIQGGKIYIASTKGVIVSLDPTNGAEVWVYPLPKEK